MATHAELGRVKSVLMSHACASLLRRLHLDPVSIYEYYDIANGRLENVREDRYDASDNEP